MGEVVSSTTKISEHHVIGYQVQPYHYTKFHLILPKTKYNIKNLFLFRKPTMLKRADHRG